MMRVKTVSFCVLIVVTGFACAPQPTLPISVRESIHRVDVSVSSTPPKVTLHTPWSKSDAAERSSRVIMNAAMEFGASSAGSGNGMGAAGIRLGALAVGAGISLANAGHARDLAKPDEVVVSQNRLILESFTSLPLDQLLQTNADRAFQSVLSDVNQGRAPPPDAGVYFLELSISEIGLRGPEELDPDVRLFMVVKGRLSTALANRPLYSFELQTEGLNERNFEQWSKCSAAELGRELEAMMHRVSERAAEELVVYEPI